MCIYIFSEKVGHLLDKLACIGYIVDIHFQTMIPNYMVILLIQKLDRISNCVSPVLASLRYTPSVKMDLGFIKIASI